MRIKIVVPFVSNCYTLLNCVHSVGVPEPASFKDLIAVPQRNGYSGLLTKICVFADQISKDSNFRIVEVSIQTPIMEQASRLGVTQLDCYKAVKTGVMPNLPEQELLYINRMRELLSDTQREEPARLIVFTHHLDAIKIRDGATALDLAYKIHSDLGSKAISAQINGKAVDLKQRLSHGDAVTIISAKKPMRTEDDLAFVAERTTKHYIRRALNKEPVAKGRRLLLEYLNKRGAGISDNLVDEYVAKLAPTYQCTSPAKLYAVLGGPDEPSGKSVTVGLVGAEIVRLRQIKSSELRTIAVSDPATDWIPAFNENSEHLANLPFRLCSICLPNPSLEIAGVKTRKHIAVHTLDCHKSREKEKIKLKWSRVARMVNARIHIQALDRPLLINNITEVVFYSGCGLGEIHGKALSFGQAIVELQIYARDAVELIQLMLKLHRVSSVKTINLENTSLPPVIKARIQKGPLNENLIMELEAQGYGKQGARILIESTRVAYRYGKLIIGYTEQKPTFASELFFGRQSEIDWLRKHTIESSGGLVLITGMKRIGKTSLCIRFLDGLQANKELDVKLERIDLRSYRRSPSSAILPEIYNRISLSYNLPLASYCSADQLVSHIETALSNNTLDKTRKHLVLVLDEFGGPVESYREGVLGTELFDFINQAMDRKMQLSIILVVPPAGRAAMDECKIAEKHLRPMAEKKIGPLSSQATKEMILQPLKQGGANFGKGAMEDIVQLTGGFPYYIILMLKEIALILGQQAHTLYVTKADVAKSTKSLLESNAAFSYFWTEIRRIPHGENIIQSLIKHKSSTRDVVTEGQLLDDLSSSYSISNPEWHVGLGQLIENNILERTSSKTGRNSGLRFTLPLLHHWLVAKLPFEKRDNN